jgi:DNA invertase Pin-like site-specific DNA recombinase
MLSSMLTIGYIRVASIGKHPDHAVQAQAQTIRERAAAEHADLELITDIGESGRNMNRPGLQRMLSLIAAGKVQCVVVTRFDRLTRSQANFARLLERLDRQGVSLVSVDGTFDSRFAPRPAVHESSQDSPSHERVVAKE